MVSEQRRSSYAAAVSGVGESNQGAPAATPVTRSPTRGIPESVPQRNSFQLHRSHNTEELEDPLYLSPNDSPSIVLVSPALTGSANYSTWSISMRIALEVKNKWTLVNGSTTAPSIGQINYGPWRRCNLMICAWIFKSVHSSIVQSIMHFDKAADIWEDLRRRFSQQDAQRISILQNDIYNLKQGTLSVNDYYTRCRSLWEQMNTLRPFPLCKCEPRCCCDLADTIRKERDTDQVIRFLQGLNEDYNNLKSNVLVLDPLPDAYKVFVMAEKQERQINLNNLNLGILDVNQANAVQNIANDEAMAATLNSYNSLKK